MTELSFTKSFLQDVDSKPIRLSYDYAVPPEDIRLPVPYTLPRLQPPHPPMAKKIKIAAAPGSAKSINVQLKSARNPVLEFSVDNAPLTTTTIHDLREAVRGRVVAGDGKPPPADKIKILYKKKPIGGSSEKTLAEILSDSEPDVLAGGKTVEFGVMIMGGASVKSETTESPIGAAAKVVETEPFASVPAQGLRGQQVLQTEEFWKDLEGFLELRTKDTVEALRLAGVFKRAWQADAARS
ncbi:cell-cycle control medial ring component [Talaromyces proteolyticus]|uniref:Cell-cycle control medial ring component n=1 Tax=Talaromyces proteolyticus TaxID=1131652 RepID=A0AAD4KTA8_9EURO|nr:cell-cycle control medial ring component [Talaromyces proteolyticus]KAH8697827.1 cell-cycle control medial ring component [Talaromyces proteolyticus]